METKFICIHLGSSSHLIALYTGAPLDELSQLIKSIFRIPSNMRIIGFESFDGTIFPLSVASKYPEIMNSSEYIVLLANNDNQKQLGAQFNQEEDTENLLDLISELAEFRYINRKELLRLKRFARFQPKETGLYDAFLKYQTNNDMPLLREKLSAIARKTDIRFTQNEKKYLYKLIDGFLFNENLSQVQCDHLRNLVKAGNDLILVAIDTYETDRDEESLQETLIQIANLLSSTKDTISIPSESSAGILSSTPQTEAVVDYLRHMYTNKLLSKCQVQLLETLVSEDNPYVEAAFEVFESDKDEIELRETLLRLVKLEGICRGAQGNKGNLNISSSYKKGSEREATSIKDRRNVAALYPSNKLVKVVNELRNKGFLDGNVVELLREMISDQNYMLLSAYKSYEVDQDFNKLGEAILQLVQIFFKETDLIASKMNESSSKMTTNPVPDEFISVLDHMEENNYISKEDNVFLEQLYFSGNELIEAAWVVYCIEQDEEDLIDTILRILARMKEKKTQALSLLPRNARKEMQSVIKDMLEQELIDNDDEVRLRQLLDTASPVMVAAAEAYSADGDLEELIDTLRLVAKHTHQPLPLCSPDSNLQALYCLRDRNLLPFEQFSLLVRLALQDNSLLLDAFSRHSLIKDPEGLAESLIHLADEWSTYELDLNANPVKELLALVDILLKEGLITLERHKMLTQAIHQCNEQILQAYNAYCSNSDLEELMDILQKIDVSKSLLQTTSSSGIKQLEQIVDIFLESNAITESEANALKDLVNIEDERILAAFDLYERTQDAVKLVNTVKRIASLHHQKKEKKQSIEEIKGKMKEFVQQMNLKKEEGKQLEQCIDQWDTEIEEAYELHFLQNDFVGLKEVLNRIVQGYRSKQEETDVNLNQSEKLESDNEQNSTIESNSDQDEKKTKTITEANVKLDDSFNKEKEDEKTLLEQDSIAPQQKEL